MRRIVTLLLLATVLMAPFTVHAKEAATDTASSDLNFKEIVLEHIGDSYWWHIVTTKSGKEIVVHLPVIARSKSTGWHCFSSSHIMHGAEYQGFSIAVDGKHKGKIVEKQPDGTLVKPFDISITKTALGLMFNALVVIILIMIPSLWYRRHTKLEDTPHGFAGIIEWLIVSILDGVIKPCVGPHYRKFAPFLLTLFFFIFISNILGLIPLFPAGANVTGNIAITFVLALAAFIAINIFGTKEHYKSIFWPDVPIFLKAPLPIMQIIEFMGMLTKPFALMVRLFANIMAGHSIILIITCIIFATVKSGAAVNTTMTGISLFLMVFMNILELLVAFIQTYVFTMLTSLFIGFAQGEEEGTKPKRTKKIITNNLKN